MRTSHATTLTLLVALAATPVSAQAVDTYFNRNNPTECQQRMRAFTAAGQRIVCVAFPPAGGNSWSIVTDQTFYNRNIPQECHDRMVAFLNAGQKIRCVAFPPAGGNSWTIVTDRTFYNRGVPQECHDRMVAFLNAGHRIEWVAYPPAGGNSWTIVTDQTFYNRNVPQECHDRMVAFANAGDRVRMVAYPPAGGNRWTVLSQASFFNRSVPSETHRVMRAMTRFPGGPLQMVAYDPDGDGFTIVSTADPDGIPATISQGAEYFSLDKFGQNLRQALDGQCVKYAFAVRLGGATRSYASGPKRTATTAPAQDFSIYDRLNPASVTKTITALAVLDALEANNVSIDALIWGFLPRTWTIPSSVRTITFKELLQHRSGFRTGGYYYDELQAMVAAGINLANKVPEYSNLNYALARILVAGLNGFTGIGVIDPGTVTSQMFIDYVQTHVFDPIGAPSVMFSPDAVEPTLFFPEPPGTSTGTTYGDWALRPGSAGVNVSIAELVTVLDKLRNTSTILSPTMRTLMDQHDLGWDRSTNKKNAVIHHKGGYFPGSWNGGAELHSTFMQFDNGISVTAVVNGTLGIGGIVFDAYEAAWQPKALIITSATPTLANVTKNTIEILGQDLDLTTEAWIGRYRVTRTDPSDPTQGFFQVTSGKRVLFHPPQGLPTGSYKVVLSSGLASSNSADVSLTPAIAPVILTPPYVKAGTPYTAILGTGRVNAAQAWFAFSTNPSPSILPGIVSLGLGNAWSQVNVWPTPAVIDPLSHSARFDLPSVPGMAGLNLWYQGLFLTPTLPLPVTDLSVTAFAQ
jgi:CubicO group peptidase (beta-lactamase class C family)